ncbi:uncharacterized protein EI90DRAFT_3042298 [Cantharellus anzutake]|uniref:uncharacterized protein n=1 Tax=Cantharellus anzutake TaxID=1750568 RepID=UPI001906977D|nr:uncharacterized protein EI90DRAFT_3042298 [Cantharellus anzutake]KAF8338260.1 hypothetical protein EI90DRAFT_3042298 [Cantharellus anzutake]
MSRVAPMGKEGCWPRRYLVCVCVCVCSIGGTSSILAQSAIVNFFYCDHGSWIACRAPPSWAVTSCQIEWKPAHIGIPIRWDES